MKLSNVHMKKLTGRNVMDKKKKKPDKSCEGTKEKSRGEIVKAGGGGGKVASIKVKAGAYK
jgi:hypothetical protein